MLRNLLLLLVTTGLMLGFAEIVLRAVTPFPIHGHTDNQVPHPALNYTLDPSIPDVDAAGFRNPQPVASAPRVDVAALGDSMTYGINVTSSLSWPAQLGALTGLSVYNFGVGSYGVLQYYETFRMALAKRPRHVVLALYIGNDFSVGYCEAALLDHWSKAGESGLIENVACRGRGHEAHAFSTPEPLDRSALISAVRYFSNQVNAIAEAKMWLYRLVGKFGAKRTDLEYHDLTVRGKTLSILAKRISGMRDATDLSNPEVAEAFRNGLALFHRMNDEATAAGATFGIVILPTKPRVMRDWGLRNGLALAPEYEQAMASVEEFLDALETRLDEAGIAWIEPIDEMVELLDRATARDELVYPIGNGHPMANGYAVFAEAAHRLLGSR